MSFPVASNDVILSTAKELVGGTVPFPEIPHYVRDDVITSNQKLSVDYNQVISICYLDLFLV